MKKVFIILAALAVMTFVSCGGKKEEVKTVSLHDIVGTHSDLIDIPDGDSIKLTLVKDQKKWRIKASLPLENTESWSSVEGANTEFEPIIDYLCSDLYDANGIKLSMDFFVKNEYDLKSILSSEETKQMNLQIQTNAYSYKEVKEIFDKVSSIGLRQADLKEAPKPTSTTSSSSSYSDDDDIDVDDILDDYEKALEVSKKSLEAAKKVDKSTKKAMEAYEDALDAYGSMFD